MRLSAFCLAVLFAATPAMAGDIQQYLGKTITDVRVEVADVTGRRVRSWTEAAGARSLRWDLRDSSGRRVAPGVYLVSVRSGEEFASRRVLVVP